MADTMIEAGDLSYKYNPHSDTRLYCILWGSGIDRDPDKQQHTWR